LDIPLLAIRSIRWGVVFTMYLPDSEPKLEWELWEGMECVSGDGNHDGNELLLQGESG